MSGIDLSPFCERESIRDLDKPFSDGCYTYASNGHIAIRVQQQDNAGPVNHRIAEQLQSMFEAADFNACHVIPGYAMPDDTACHACSGKGAHDKCPECGGDGTVCFENDYSEYVVECDTCGGHGSGVTIECRTCRGSGVRPYIPIRLGATLINLQYLHLIESLPQPLIHTARGDGAIPFTFDGGCGLVMPMRDHT